MRKLTFFLGLMLTMLATNAWAGATVPEAGKYYAIKNYPWTGSAVGEGKLVFVGEDTYLHFSDDATLRADVVFYVEQDGEDLYLKHAATGTYYQRDANFADTKGLAVGFYEPEGENYISFYTNDSGDSSGRPYRCQCIKSDGSTSKGGYWSRAELATSFNDAKSNTGWNVRYTFEEIPAKYAERLLDPSKAEDPLNWTPIPDGYYYIRSTEDAFDMVKPYIIDPGTGSAMNLKESNAKAESIWYIQSFDATNLNAENGKKYYIKNAKTGRYWVDGPSAPLGSSGRFYNIYWKDADHAFNFCGRSDGNIGNGNPVGAKSATEFGRMASGVINWQLVPAKYETVNVTYNYKYDGKVLKSEVLSTPKGEETPAPKLTAPFGTTYTLPALPEAVTEDCAFDIEVTVSENFPFQFSESYADATWYTWKMRSGYAGYDGKYFPETNADAQPTAAKNMFAFVGNPFTFNILCPNGQYMVNGGGNNEKSTCADQGSTFSVVAISGSDSEYTFAVEGKTGTINDVQKSVGFWANNASYGDAGSKIYLDESAGTKLYQIVFAEGTPAAASVTYNGETFTPATAFSAIAAKTVPTAADFTTAKIKDFKSEITVEGNNIKVEYVTTKSAEWVALGNTITAAKATEAPEGPWGTDPGYYSKDAVEALPAAIATAEAAYNKDYNEDEAAEKKACKEADEALQAAIAAAELIMPEVGKVYQFINGFPTFEATQGHKKAIYSDGSGLLWKQVDNTDKSFYWTVTKVDGNDVTFQNYDNGKYPIGYTTYNQTYPVSDTENYCLLTALGEGQFNILPNGAGAVLHAGDHGGGSGVSGRIMIWNAGVNTCSSWYIHETTDIMAIVDKVADVAVEAKAAQASAAETLTKVVSYPYEWTTDAAQFSSNKPCPSEGSLASLIDGDANTFFHSDWTGTFGAGIYHELYVSDLDEDVTLYDISFMRRNASNDHATQLEVYGGTVEIPENPDSEAAEFTIESGEDPLAVIDIPLEAYPDNGIIRLDLGDTGYEALCFRVTATDGTAHNFNAESRAYFHFAEFHLLDANRVIPAENDAPEDFVETLNSTLASLNKLLANPALSEEYVVKLNKATAAVVKATTDVEANTGKNKPIADQTEKYINIQSGSKTAASVEVPLKRICKILEINDISEAKNVAINASTGFTFDAPNYVTETGYRDANGDICAKKEAIIKVKNTNTKFTVTPTSAAPANVPCMNIYSVYTANQKAYLLNVIVNFVQADSEDATAINGISAKLGNSGIIYDLQGRKVSAVKAGQVYIVNGEKIMVK